MRINRFLADLGLGSRRSVEKLIVEGRIRVNRAELTELSFQVDPQTDFVEFDGKLLSAPTNEPASSDLNDALNTKDDIWIYHKVAGFLSTRSDPNGRATVFEDLDHLPPPYQAVGRLDRDTRGLLLITCDGELLFRLTHPSFEIPRVYEARVEGVWKKHYPELLEKGVNMKEGGIGKAQVLHEQALGPNKHFLRLLLKRGKKREIRYSLSALGLETIDLFRLQYANVQLGNLAPRESRALNKTEKNELKKMLNLFSP